MTNNKSMQTKSHQSAIHILRDAVDAWRKANEWSRETVVQEIVEAHVKAGFELPSGIVFDPQTKDAYKRMKVNADRVYRWLDDVTKDNNLLPINFMNSILIAMPLDRRLSTANQLNMPVNISCSSLNIDSTHGTTVSLLQQMIAESAEANNSIASLIDGETREELHTAHKEVSEAIKKLESARMMVESKIFNRNQKVNHNGRH